MTQGRRQALLLGVGCEGGLALLAWLLGRLLNQPPLRHFSLNARDLALGALSSLPLLLGFILLIRGTPHLKPLLRIRHLCVEVIEPFFRPCTAFDLALICSLAGLGEE